MATEIRVKDPYRAHVMITISASTSMRRDGTWRPHVHVDNPGYMTVRKPEPVFTTRADAEDWARHAVAEEIERLEKIRDDIAAINSTNMPVDLSHP